MFNKSGCEISGPFGWGMMHLRRKHPLIKQAHQKILDRNLPESTGQQLQTGEAVLRTSPSQWRTLGRGRFSARVRFGLG